MSLQVVYSFAIIGLFFYEFVFNGLVNVIINVDFWGGGHSLIKVGTDVRARALGFQGSIFARALDFGR